MKPRYATYTFILLLITLYAQPMSPSRKPLPPFGISYTENDYLQEHYYYLNVEYGIRAEAQNITYNDTIKKMLRGGVCNSLLCALDQRNVSEMKALLKEFKPYLITEHKQLVQRNIS